jgi:hypothetical protein
MERLNNLLANMLQRLSQAFGQIVTRFNALFTVLALYAMAHHDVHEKLLPFVPEDYRQIAGVILPIAFFWLAQKGKEVDRARTIAQARIDQ